MGPSAAGYGADGGKLFFLMHSKGTSALLAKQTPAIANNTAATQRIALLKAYNKSTQRRHKQIT